MGGPEDKNEHVREMYELIERGQKLKINMMEMKGIEPSTSRMRSERSTPELHPLNVMPNGCKSKNIKLYLNIGHIKEIMRFGYSP